MTDKKYNFIYCTTNLINGKKYVGQHCTNIDLKNDYYLGSGIAFSNAVKKYGRGVFKREILEYCIPCQNHIDFKERFWIKEINTITPYGYNLDLGGLGKGKVSEETKQKISKNNKGRIVSEETRKKMSEIFTGRKFSKEEREQIKLNKIKKGTDKVSEETRKKQSEAHKGYVPTQKSIDKFKESRKKNGYVFTEEHRKNIGDSKKGKPSHNKGVCGKYTHSEETKKLMSNQRKGKLNAFYGKTFSEEHLEKYRKAISEISSIECPYCGMLDNSIGNMKRWHFDNCKKNPNFIPKEKIKIDTIICPYCNKEGAKHLMKRFHFDNCLCNPESKREENIHKCPHCNMEGKYTKFKNSHFENCKQNPNYIPKDNKLTCSYCNLVGRKENMTRYHFNNCKHKPKDII